MDMLIQSVSRALPYYLLVFTRVTGMFALSPVFGRRNVPARLKIGFSLILTYIFITAFPSQAEIAMDDLIVYTVLCAKELIIGLILGYITILFTNVTFTAGQIIDTQMGLGLSGIFDPNTSAQVSSSGMMLNLLMMLYFFSVNGHHMLIKIFSVIFGKIPVGNVHISAGVVSTVVQSFTLAFLMAVNLAMPIIASAMLVELGLGLMVRTVPQMNAFIVGIPVKILIGFVVLYLMQPFYVQYCSYVFEKMFESAEIIFGEMIALS